MNLSTLRTKITPQVIDRLLVIIALSCVIVLITAVAHGQDKSSYLLSPEEVTSLEKIQKDAQAQGQKEAQAAQVIVDADADNLDAITLAALKYRKISRDGRQTISTAFQSWLSKAQSAHKCPDCTLSQDGKSLIAPPAQPKPAAN